MTKRVVDLGARPILDVVSHGRAGATLTPLRREAIARTVGGTPEVVVKVSGGGGTVGGVTAHLRYIGRHGRLPLELDEGDEVTGMPDVRALIQDWDLKTEQMSGARRYSGKSGIKGPRIVYNLVFSMPAGTSPPKVLNAVRNFAQEQWGLEHRYAMVLHTDTASPHVHVVLKAVSEQGQRLYIDRERLRDWRQEFARHLRREGVAANATHRTIRGKTGRSPRDGLYRAMRRQDSIVLRERIQTAANQLRKTGAVVDAAGTRVRLTRYHVEQQWRAEQEAWKKAGDLRLATDIEQFVKRMPPARTEMERVKEQLERRGGIDIAPS